MDYTRLVRATALAGCVVAVGCRPDDVSNIDGLSAGQSLMREQRYEDALAWFDRALTEQVAAGARASDVTAPVRLAVLRIGRGLALNRLRRRSEAVDTIRRALDELEPLAGPEAPMARALAQVALARVMNETGRSFDAVQPATRAVEWWSSVTPRTPRHAEAECELGRALILTGQSADGRALLGECVDVYRAWDRADPQVVRALEQLR